MASEKVKVYYPGTDTVWKKYYVNEAGVKHGEYRMYWPDGETKVKGFYVLGKLDGDYKEYYPSGARWLLRTYKAGVLDGLYRQWYPQGQLEIETHYRNGVDVGPYCEWEADGRLVTDIPAGHPCLGHDDKE
jgi:antitoxin component YwqK of YwqJK toxin-antitoxin module